MSQENVELVRRAYEVLTPREFSRIPEFFAPDIEIDLTRNVFNPATVRGYEGIERFVGLINDVWDDFRFEVEELIDARDVWTMGDGRCTRGELYRDRAEALEAAALSDG